MRRNIIIIMTVFLILQAETLFEVKDASNNKVLDISTDGLRVLNLGDTLMVISTQGIRADLGDPNKGLSRTFSVTTSSSKDKSYGKSFEVTSAITTVGTNETQMGLGASKYSDLTPENIFIGLKAGINTSDGVDNIFIGNNSGTNNFSGYNNIFIGDSTGVNNTTGIRNLFIGNKSGKLNSTGINNLFLGMQSGVNNQIGNFNHFIGYQAGFLNSTGNANTFIGFQSGMSCTSSYNTFVGSNTGNNCSSGSGNCILGYGSGVHMSTGCDNVLLGQNVSPLYSIGSNNVLLGSSSGYNLGAGSSGNVFLGYKSGHGQSGNRNNTLIIESGYVDGNDMYEALIWGDFANNNLRFNAGVGIKGNNSQEYGLYVEGGISPNYSAYFSKGAYTTGSFVSGSDLKWKTNISSLAGSLDKIKSIRGVNYDWRKNDFPDKGFSDRKQIGVIAQEVEKVLPELVYTDSNGDKGVDYAKMSAVLIEAVKELDVKTSEIENLKAEIEKIKQFVKMEK